MNNPQTPQDDTEARLERIDDFLDRALPDGRNALSAFREEAESRWRAAGHYLTKAYWRACLARAAVRRPDDPAAPPAAALAAELARRDVETGEPLAACAGEDMANLHAAWPAERAAAGAAQVMEAVIDHGLDVDANAVLGPLDAEQVEAAAASLSAYADRREDHFCAFRACMILFGIFHRDASAEGGTVYVNTGAEPDNERAERYYARAQARYVEGVRLRLDAALRRRGLHGADSLEAYALRIPASLSDRTLTVKTGVRIELDSCVGNDHVLISQEIGAEVINISVLLKDEESGAYDYPIRVHVRRLDEPVLRLASVDKHVPPYDVTRLEDVFGLEPEGDNEWVRLSKASLIATGIVPNAFRDRSNDVTLAEVMRKLGGGLQITTEVRGVPVGSGTGTSSAIAAAIIAALAAFTGQTQDPPPAMRDEDRMLVVARVLLVEQLIGALGGWQDPCAIFPGVKLLWTKPGDFLPAWRPLQVPAETLQRLPRRLKLTDGAYRQPSQAAAWQFTGLWVMRLARVYEARMESRRLVREQIRSLEGGRIEAVGPVESRDWVLRGIISPRATNAYTEEVIEGVRRALGPQHVDVDGCGARGGAGGCWWIDPEHVSDEAFEQAFVGVSRDAIEHYRDTIRFEGRPRVYDYAINEAGLVLELSRSAGP